MSQAFWRYFRISGKNLNFSNTKAVRTESILHSKSAGRLPLYDQVDPWNVASAFTAILISIFDLVIGIMNRSIADLQTNKNESDLFSYTEAEQTTRYNYFHSTVSGTP